MKKLAAVLLALCIVLGAFAVSAEIWVEAGDEEGEGPASAEYYSDDGILAVFSAVKLELPGEFPVRAGEAYEGKDGSMFFAGAVYGDGENGTVDFILLADKGEGPEAETVLSVIYSRDRIALLEMDDGMKLWQNGAGLYLAAVSDNGTLSKEEAAALLNDVFEEYGLTELVFTDYDVAPGSVLDLSGEAVPGGTIVTGVTPASFRGKKIIMVNFFESWCGPCMKEMPALEQLYEDYGEEGFQLLGVFMTPGDDKNIESVIEQFGITFPVLDGSDGSLAMYASPYVPTSVFFDGDGTLLEEETVIGSGSYELFEEKIQQYLG